MHEIDKSTIDKRLLHQFLTVYDVNSVSRAAEILEINQSSVSHALERLRKIVGDPLFVRSGRGIAPTERAHVIATEAREIIVRLDNLVSTPIYNPLLDTEPFTVMANDYEIETVIKPRFAAIREKAPLATLRIINSASGSDIPEMLRKHVADLVLNPDCDVDATDIKQKRIFSDQEEVFYDSSIRNAPLSIDEYCSAQHAMLVLGNIRITEIESTLLEQGRTRKIVLETQTFSALADLIRGTDIVATMPSKLSKTAFLGFDKCQAPFSLQPFSIMQMWHVSNDNSPRNKWYRSMFVV